MPARIDAALALHQAGRLVEAEQAYREILRVEPRHFDALHFLGVIHYQRGAHAEAVELIARAIAVSDAQPAAYSNLANALEALGEVDGALQSYRRALALKPDYVDALINIGALHAGRGELREAEASYRRALELAPDLAVAHSNLGNVLREFGRLEEAGASHRRALELDPRQPAAHSNLGTLLHQQGRLDEAAAAFKRAIELRPDFAEAYCNLGNVLSDQGQLVEAIATLRRAVELKPYFAEAHSNLANTLQQNGALAQAEAELQEALRLKPHSAHPSFNLALLKLMQGDYAAGLPLYESRFREHGLSRLYSALHARAALLGESPRWQGEDPARRRLLVWTDQGLGDSLMMLRYLPLLKQRGFARLVVYCEPALVRLVQTFPAVDEVVASSDPLPVGRFDCHCPIMSLPLAFGTRVDTVPSGPYIKVPAAMVQDWAGRLGAVLPPRVGLLWAGGALYPRNSLRSIALARLAPVVEQSGISFVSLQKGDEEPQLKRSGWPIADRMRECHDLLDTAALISQLDLVIGVDSAVTHLAGALGKPMFMLNRFESEWRWLFEGDVSPWYPTIRIFRQPAPGDWDSVVARVAAALADHDFGIGRDPVE